MIGVDTTFLIHLLRNEKNAREKSIELDKEAEIFTTEANVYELVSGIKDNKTDVKRALTDLEILLARFTVLPLDRKAAIYSGHISSKLMRTGFEIDDMDCLVAGILLSNGCNKILTKNIKHFERVQGLEILTY